MRFTLIINRATLLAGVVFLLSCMGRSEMMRSFEARASAALFGSIAGLIFSLMVLCASKIFSPYYPQTLFVLCVATLVVSAIAWIVGWFMLLDDWSMAVSEVRSSLFCFYLAAVVVVAFLVEWISVV